MSTKNSFKDSQKIIQSLVSTFPNCFSKEGPAKPLKIGIFKDLVVALELEKPESVISKVALRRALRVYTEQWRYLHSFVEGAKRVGLSGELGDELKPEEIVFAKAHLEESKKKYTAWKQSVDANRKQSQPKAEVVRTEAQKEGFKPKVAKKSAPKSTIVAKKAASTTQTTTSPMTEQAVSAKMNLTAIDTKVLKVGDLVYAQMSTRPVKGTVSKLDKVTAKVILESGMELAIPIKRLFVQK